MEDWAKKLHSETLSHWLLLQHVLLCTLVEVTKDFSDNIIFTAFRNLWQAFNLQIHKTQHVFLTFSGNCDSCKIRFTSGRVLVGENHIKKEVDYCPDKCPVTEKQSSWFKRQEVKKRNQKPSWNFCCVAFSGLIHRNSQSGPQRAQAAFFLSDMEEIFVGRWIIVAVPFPLPTVLSTHL